MNIKNIFLLLSITLANVSFAYYAYVADLEAQTVFIMDTNTNNVIGTVSSGEFPLFQDPYSIVSSPDGKRTYVGDLVGGLFIIDTDVNSPTFNTVIGLQILSAAPISLAITPDGKTIYVGVFNPSTPATAIYVFDTNSNTFLPDPVAGGIDPMGYISSIAFYVDGTYAYATDIFAGGFYVIDTQSNSVIDWVSLSGAASVAFSPDGNLAYFACSPGSGPPSVTVIDANPGHTGSWNSPAGAVTVGPPFDSYNNPIALAISPDGNKLFILDSGNQCIYTANTATFEVTNETAVSLSSLMFLIPTFGVVPDGSSVYITPLDPVVEIMNTTDYTINPVTYGSFMTPRGVSFVNPSQGRAFQRPSNRR